jgi:hypothetical protein
LTRKLSVFLVRLLRRFQWNNIVMRGGEINVTPKLRFKFLQSSRNFKSRYCPPSPGLKAPARLLIHPAALVEIFSIHAKTARRTLFNWLELGRRHLSGT